MITTSIKKWGNSLAVRIPQVVAQELDFTPETQVELEVTEGELHIKLKT
ncbi:MAG TPA: AbrB/MazE/SpoVT family DNA-binding domain-containing protein, partial [Candidatus Marinimicrobia bacterium]|nr:AbrB/MazE/SpoVT family DNA-binding domain-containing protein [Candidatus Neomarinimicrobiota bacterium]